MSRTHESCYRHPRRPPLKVRDRPPTGCHWVSATARVSASAVSAVRAVGVGRYPRNPQQTDGRIQSALQLLLLVRRTRIPRCPSEWPPCPQPRPRRQNEKRKEERFLSLSTTGSSCRWWWRAGVGGKDGCPCSDCAVCGPGE